MGECERCREFDENESDPLWGWDGEHVEDAVSFARHFRRERDEARAEIERLRGEADTWKKTHIGTAANAADQIVLLEAEIERLRAIVDGMPKTVDRVPIKHLMELFTTRPGVFENGAEIIGPSGQPLAFFVALGPTNGMSVDWEYVYSTREAAEAAKGGE